MKHPVSVYTEMTPNPDVMKFVTDRELLPAGVTVEFTTKAQTLGFSPLAEEIFNFPFVTRVFISGSFVSVTKDDTLGWDMIVSQMREYLWEWLSDHLEAVTEVPDPASCDVDANADPSIVELDLPAHEIDDKIRELIAEFVQPAVENDGGAIEYKGFSNGVVHVRMRGACAGCPSSSQTLKSGIERLLQSYLPEIQEVVAST
ncbi:MAG: NifU family protein [Flavobacteriales bacterium]|nr:NifU family protein [Flavobacteriales bacterium]